MKPNYARKAKAISAILKDDPPPGTLIQAWNEVFAVVLTTSLGMNSKKVVKIAELHDGQPVPRLNPLYAEYCATGKVLSKDESAGVLMTDAVEDRLVFRATSRYKLD